MTTLAVMSAGGTASMFFILPIGMLAMRYEKQLAQRIPSPRFVHLEFRLWLLLLIFSVIVIWFVALLVAVFAWDLFILKPNARYEVVYNSPFPDALGYIAAGFAIFVLPLLLLAVYFDFRIRADAPEPPAAPAEVRALRLYLGGMLSAIMLLVVVSSLLLAVIWVR